MRLYIVCDNGQTVEVSAADAFIIQRTYPDVIILSPEQLPDYLEAERIKLIYG
jgi:hypothetical protein